MWVKEECVRYTDEVVDIKWISAKNEREAFIQEHILIMKNGVNNDKTYNLINSPGQKFYLEEFK